MRHLFAKMADRAIPVKSDEYKKLVVGTFLKVPFFILFSRAFFYFMKGLYLAIVGKTKEKQTAFLAGSGIWGNATANSTRTNVKLFNEISVPDNGHFIFINHVNEMDFSFDCKVIQKPFLANQEIKSTYIAYWWMKAMGSEVFDKSDKRTIARSVKNLLKGLKTQSYIVYPEGRNTYSENINPLKKGMINLSYKLKIPILLVLKSGMTGFHNKPYGNTIAYKSCGIIRPDGFATWEEYRDHIYELMKSEKYLLDSELGILPPSDKTTEKELASVK